MKNWLYPLAIALGFTTLFCDSLLSFSGFTAFHWSATPASLYLAGIVDFLAIWLLLGLALCLVHPHTRARNRLWALMIVCTPAFVVEKLYIADRINLSSGLHHAINLACLVLWVLVATVFYNVFARYAEKTMLIYAFYAVGGLVLLAHAAWCGWCARNLNPPFPPKAIRLDASAQRPRVVWIIMDELPYQFIFSHRPPGLELPAFDALARTATVFTAATPPSTWTELATSSYLTSLRVTSLSQHLDGSYDLHTAESRSPVSFNQRDTVFQDARDAGYSTAAAGWVMPYCRLLPEVLDRCFWTVAEPLENGMSAGATFSGNLAAPFLFAAPHLLPAVLNAKLHISSNRSRRVAYHIRDYTRLHQAAERLLRDPSLGFVYLHLPVPHNPSIYDRSSAAVRYVPTNSFLDNLALADRCLAELRSVLEETNQWDNTTLLLMGDHGWRGEAPDFPHDHAATLDLRQAYIVKLVGQKTPRTIDAPYDSLRTRSLLRTLMQRKIQTPAELERWVQSAP